MFRTQALTIVAKMTTAVFVDKTTSNRGRLLRYLFSDESFVLTGNDNSEYDVDICALYPHEEYYKGN